MKFIYSSDKSITKFLLILLLIIMMCPAAKSTTITITVEDYQFTPNNVSVSVGDTIKWQWLNGSHTTTCDGIFPGTSLPAGAATWDALMNSGTPVFTYPITVAGTYNYVCQPHSPSMAGTIVANGSSVLLTENFDYPVGDSLGAHGWNWINSAINILTVTSPGLVYPGYPLSNIGNATTVQNTGEDSYKSMTAADSTGSLYVSFMVNVTSAQAIGDYFFALLPPNSTTLYTGRFYARDSAGLRFGISKSTAAAGGIFYTGNSYSLGTTYVIVIKYKFNTGSTNDDEVSFFVFSSGIPATEPSTPTVGPVVGTANDNALGRVALRQGTAANAPVAMVDGIRATTEWSDISTGVQSISGVVADNFHLSQNYPNPFNPSTTIKFSIPERGFVNLVIYNTLGKEVRSLVSENLGLGTYSSILNAGDLNSGVYFYKLIFSGDNGSSFIETKKLILLK